jgi:flagellar hook-length control protein FliK
MNPSITQLILSDGNHDQSAAQGVSNTKKTINGKQKITGLFDLIGGAGSFASIMKQKGIFFSIEKGNSESDGSISCQTSAAGKNAVKRELHGTKYGQGYLSLKEENDRIDSIPLGDQKSQEKDMKHDIGVLSSKVMADIKTKGDIPVGRWDKSKIIMEKESIDKEDNKVNLPDGSPKNDIDAGQIKSALEKDNKISLKKIVGGLDRVQKPPSDEATQAEGKAVRDSGVLSAGGFKVNNSIRKDELGVMRAPSSGDGEEDHQAGDLDLSKASDIKGVKVNKVSSNTKEHEVLLKSDSPKPEVARENPISSNQLKAMSENAQGYKSDFAEGLKLERSVERGNNETITVKTDTSLWTAQADYPVTKGNDSSSWTNNNGDIVAPLRFQDVADQIMDDASNILKKGSGRIVITLEPPNLGTLNMDVRVQHDTVRMLLIADNHEVKQVLHSNLDQLKTALQGQGLNVDRFDVLVQERNYDGNPGFQPGGGALFEEGRGRRDNTKEDNHPSQMVPSGGNELNEPSLGSISLFV